MSKAESNKRWSDAHRKDISSYNQDYYEQKKAELQRKRRERYQNDPAYRAAALARAKANRKKRQLLQEAKPKKRG